MGIDLRKDVERKLPGILFKVDEESYRTAPGSGRKIGKIVLRCDLFDEAMWRPLIKRLDGLKLFSVEREAEEAFNEAFDEASKSIAQLEEEVTLLRVEKQRAEEEIARLRAIMGNLGSLLETP